jgi:hypothetical protein
MLNNMASDMITTTERPRRSRRRTVEGSSANTAIVRYRGQVSVTNHPVAVR